MICVTIDGGAASGKSSTARGVAEELNLVHVDTGAHYRAVTLGALNEGVDPDDGDRLGSFLATLKLATVFDGRDAILTVNGIRPFREDLRSDRVNRAVSRYAALPLLRSLLLDYQRSIPGAIDPERFAGVVVEGRDIGSVVFPDARYRFFLEADPVTRESRRAAQGEVDSVQDRDASDSRRKTAPLICPEGAIRINTGTMDLRSVIDTICRRVAPTRFTP